ncbi:MAG: PEP-CTERM sorting domain-containing protein [Coleofasciculus sp. B1-GNL1-01]|uniref:PEP-CTERM sorting domain-containing protein n=1 Tax=Coleofasciculus sp. B1-GNL1-01 TaxID=3068484 RepID=UPI003302DC45
MIHKRRLALAFTAATVATTLAAPAQALVFNLGDLISNNQSITVGDKEFGNFECIISQTGTTTPNSCNSINVQTKDDDPFGLLFQTGFSARSTSTNPSSSLDVFLAYDITVLDPNKRLDSALLKFDGSGSPPSALANDDVLAKVTQTIKAMDNTTVGTAEVFAPPANNKTDQVSLDQKLAKARVENQINIEAKNGARGFISVVENRYEQTEVPEPGTIGGLLAVGSLGIGSILKQFKQKK